jgi:hypothetical protein
MAIGGLQEDIHGHIVMSLSPSDVPGRVQNLAVGAAAVQSTGFIGVNPYSTSLDTGVVNPAIVGTTHIRLVSNVDCYVMITGAGFVLTASNGMLLPAGSPEYFPVDGTDFVYVIQSAVAGTLNIVECE